LRVFGVGMVDDPIECGPLGIPWIVLGFNLSRLEDQERKDRKSYKHLADQQDDRSSRFEHSAS
jgi:hypothetical protein